MNIVSTNVENNNYYNPNTTFEIEKGLGLLQLHTQRVIMKE